MGPLSVAALLDLDALVSGNPVHLNPTSSSLDRGVRWVHVGDAAESAALLEGSELVLSTGGQFRGSEARTRAFLDDLESADAAGLVVELIDDDGCADDRAIAELRRASADRHIPVIALRRQVRFVRITQAAHRLLIGEQVALLEQARHSHEVFTALSLEGADEQRIVDTAADLLAAGVVLEDASHRVLAFSPGPGSAEELLQRWVEDPGRLREARLLQTAVGVRERRWGRLIADLAAADDDRTQVAAAQILERAGQAVTMARMARQDEIGLLQSAQSGFIRELREGPPLAEAEATARAATLGMPAAEAFLPAVIRITQPGDRDGEQPLISAEGQMAERSAVDALTSAARRNRVSVLIGRLRTGTIAVLLGAGGGEEAEESLTRVLERTTGALSVGDEAADQWTVGAGPVERSLADAAGHLDEAADIADIAAAMRFGGRIRSQAFYRFADVRLRGALTALRHNAHLTTFASAELGPILDDPKLMGFLRAFLDAGGSMTRAARTAGVSRPAAYARTERIETALGIRLDDAESRTSLHTALLWIDCGGELR